MIKELDNWHARPLEEKEYETELVSCKDCGQEFHNEDYLTFGYCKDCYKETFEGVEMGFAFLQYLDNEIRKESGIKSTWERDILTEIVFPTLSAAAVPLEIEKEFVSVLKKQIRIQDDMQKQLMNSCLYAQNGYDLSDPWIEYYEMREKEKQAQEDKKEENKESLLQVG